MYNRLLASSLAHSKKSILLLGPRQVGKSTLIKSLRPDLEINLAHEGEYFRFQSDIEELDRRIAAQSPKTIFIDEIQRIPRLTNTIQALVDANSRLKFYLTGSSARKLRRGRANLLPGRLITHYLSPLCYEEMEDDWNVNDALQYGSLPGIVMERDVKEKRQVLSSYANQYLKEEILAEALVRRVDGFVRFLNVVAEDSGRYLDYSKLSQRAKVPRQSVVRHFEILEDTLLVYKIDNDPKFDNLDLVKHPRFFFFDLGVLNAIRGSFDLSSDRVGNLFEHLVLQQTLHTAQSKSISIQCHNFRTRGGLEIDFLFNCEGRRLAVECKSADNVSPSELQPLKYFRSIDPKAERIIIYRGKRELKDGGIWILPLSVFLKRWL